MKARTVNVAAIQMNSGSDPVHNLESAIALIELAADEGATYVQVPEYFNYLGPARRYAEVAESIPGPTTTRLAAVAKRRRIHLHLGSMLERREGDRPFNTSVLIDATGSIVATYRKAHLFDVDVPGAVTHRESDDLSAGEELVVARLKRFSVGLSVCFDVRFPELYQALAANGADVLAVPAAFNASTGQSHWHVLVRSRAIENHAFVVAATQAGVTAEGIATFGHALIVDPWGVILAESSGAEPQVITATLDLDEVLRRRAQIAVMRFRRPALYRGPVRVIGA
ncbi:MAG: carbon-nitrogen hydrolase family protein [Actinomycetales bacterium]|nr:carbon-nitrogen hydrolase family protein [Actinomycetales bacterium]